MIYFSTTTCTRPGIYQTELILIDSELKKKADEHEKMHIIANY